MTEIMSEVEELARTLRTVTDRLEIADLVNRYGEALDTKNFDAWEACFVEDAVTEYPWGRNESMVGLGAQAAEILAPFSATEHLTSNLHIELDGDWARSRQNVWIICVRPEDPPGVHFTEGGFYEAEYTRTEAGWRFARIRLNINWVINGDAL
jgi:3-phenylpropionate/cinnamic acid dioxygenase small subunit